ncbi:hypothetical protein [Allostreptomyces psammosilenae]|uniref:Integral membrane protein n=1 Tax=Allostreptomyces psammosilenae TaxID=1892865 RepID=A0A853A3B3_9ACTN|nr:hypothetical protein [Allostreptomyces psammosilenae]NYI07960.1 hypothetical protein [Allostreptomyces psammosilenae]
MSSGQSTSGHGTTGPGPDVPQEHNPFGPPPEGAPERPWRPRQSPRQDGDGTGHTGDGEGRGPGPWPGRLGDRDGGTPPGGDQGRPRPGADFDPRDPMQRRARYGILAGVWGVFAGLIGLWQVALLAGALAVYWGWTSFRALGGRREAPAGAAGAAGAAGRRPNGGPWGAGAAGAAGAAARPEGRPAGGRSQATAAFMGLASGVVALSFVAGTFTIRFAYDDYFTCVDQSLTLTARDACLTRLPEPLRTVYDQN